MAHPDDVLSFDIETYSADEMWDRTPREMFRLGQYAWGREGEIILTEDYDEMMDALRRARLILGHNIHAFDLTVMFGKDSTEPLQMAMDKKILDTLVWASMAYPAPPTWTDEKGHTYRDGNKPELAMKWLGLDNLSHQFDLPGKSGSLREIAKRYNPKGTKVADLDYGLIPLTDEEFRTYAYNDIVALRALSLKLLELPGGVTRYNWREQKFAAICAQNARNGWLVDQQKAQARVDELAERRAIIITDVVTKYGLPTEGKMPWRTTEGKDAIFAALADYGITPGTRPDWPLTETGNPSLGGEALIDLTEGTDAADLGEGLAALMGQRSLAQLALDSTHTDGKIHPSITAFQASGRLSTTKPGLTVWTSRGKGAVEKSYFISEPDHKLVEFDFAQADARIVAAYSGDTEFAKRFEEGADSHMMTAELVFGEKVADDPAEYRQKAKALGHAYAYRAGAKKLAATSGEPLEVAYEFVNGMKRAYPDVTRWQEKVTSEGEGGWVVNDWGRRMRCNPQRAYTQAPALYGQSGTREIMVDGLIRLAEKDIRYITWLKAQIHDAIVMDIPEEELDSGMVVVVESMSVAWKPRVGGQLVEFPLSHGNPADDWYLAGH